MHPCCALTAVFADGAAKRHEAIAPICQYNKNAPSFVSCNNKIKPATEQNYQNKMAERLHSQILEEIIKVFDRIYQSANKSAFAIDTEIAELAKPLVSALFIESVDEIENDMKFILEQLLQSAFLRFKTLIAQRKFVERHQLIQLRQMFDIRSIFQEYYEREHCAIGFIQLWTKLKRKCNFILCHDLLKRWLHQMGFKLVPQRSRQIIHEHPELRMTRLRYLRAMRKHRNDGRPLVYCREAIVSYVRWNVDEVDQSRAETCTTVIAYFAATQSGLVNSTITRGRKQTRETFINWLKSAVSLMPPNSIILLDPKKYNDALPLPAYTGDVGAVKTEKIDTIVAEKGGGHSIVYMPANHFELNPLHCIDFRPTLGDIQINDISEENLVISVRKCLLAKTADEWDRYFDDVQKREENFFQFERFIDDDTIFVDDLHDSEESDIEIVEEIDDDEVVHLSDDDDVVYVSDNEIFVVNN